MSRDLDILNDLFAELQGLSGVRRAVQAGGGPATDVALGDLPALILAWERTDERPTGSGEVCGRVHFRVSVLVKDPSASAGLSAAMALADLVRQTLLGDATRSGLASATDDGPATELSAVRPVPDRKPPVTEVRIDGTCGYYVD